MVGLCTYLVLGPVNLTSVIYGSSFVNCINVKRQTPHIPLEYMVKPRRSYQIGRPSPGRGELSQQVVTSTRGAFCGSLCRPTMYRELVLLPSSFQLVVGL